MAETLKQKRLRLLGEAERARAEAETAVAEPQSQPEASQGGLREGIRAFAGSALEGVPIAGPYIREGADRLAALKRALLSDQTYEGALTDIQGEMPRIEAEHPYASMAGSVTGAVAGMAPAVAAAPAAFGARAGGALLPSMAASGVTNAGIGAADAYVRGQDPTTGALVGGAFGAVAPALGQVAGAGVRKVLGKTPQAAAPGLDALGQQADAAYAAADRAGLVVAPTAVGRMAQSARQALAGEGFHPKLHPRIDAALSALDDAAGVPATLRQVDVLRRVAGNAGSSTDASERRLAGILIDKIDDTLDTLQPTEVIAGDAQAGVKALTEARGIWRTVKKSEVIAEVLRKAEVNASTIGKDAALRDQFKALAKNQRLWRTFSPEERAAITHAAKGGPMEGLLRLIGKAAPRGVVSALPTLAAGSIDLGAGAATALAGETGKRAATAMRQHNAGLVDALVRSGGQMPPTPPSPTAETTQRLIQALSLGIPLGAGQ